MIFKSKFQNTSNVTVLEFGDGTVTLQGCYIPDSETKIIMYKSSPPDKIGLSKSEFKTTDEFEPEIVMSFKNKESFDAVYDYMTFIKNEYLKDSVIKKI